MKISNEGKLPPQYKIFVASPVTVFLFLLTAILVLKHSFL